MAKERAEEERRKEKASAALIWQMEIEDAEEEQCHLKQKQITGVRFSKACQGASWAPNIGSWGCQNIFQVAKSLIWKNKM